MSGVVSEEDYVNTANHFSGYYPAETTNPAVSPAFAIEREAVTFCRSGSPASNTKRRKERNRTGARRGYRSITIAGERAEVRGGTSARRRQ
jgi:hypothetical protein